MISLPGAKSEGKLRYAVGYHLGIRYTGPPQADAATNRRTPHGLSSALNLAV
jgi:hypothetical protein